MSESLGAVRRIKLSDPRAVRFAMVQILRDIAKGVRPDAIDLEDAPTLVGSWPHPTKPGILRGFVYGLPSTRSGALTDVDVVLMDREGRWAWSGERFWKLTLR